MEAPEGNRFARGADRFAETTTRVGKDSHCLTETGSRRAWYCGGTSFMRSAHARFPVGQYASQLALP